MLGFLVVVAMAGIGDAAVLKEATKAYLVNGTNSSIPTVQCELQPQKVGIRKTHNIEIINTTGVDYKYDNVRRACDCTEIVPATGAIAAGQSVVIEVAIKSPSRPQMSRTGIKLLFENGGVPVFELTAVYPLEKYIGFKDAFCTAIRDSDKSGAYVFTAPLMFSSDINSNSLKLRIVNANVTQHVTFDPNTGLVKGHFSNINVDELPKLRLEATAEGENDDAPRDSIPILIEDAQDIELLPKHLRFVRGKDGAWKSSIFVKTPRPKEGDPEQVLYAELLGGPVVLMQEAMSPTLNRLDFVLKRDEEASEQGQNAAKKVRRPEHIDLKILFRAEAVVRKVPAIWIGE